MAPSVDGAFWTKQAVYEGDTERRRSTTRYEVDASLDDPAPWAQSSMDFQFFHPNLTFRARLEYQSSSLEHTFHPPVA